MKRFIVGASALAVVTAMFFSASALADNEDISQADAMPAVVNAQEQSDVVVESKPKIIKFTAHWCKSCREMEPVLERLEKRYRDRIDVVVVDVDDPENARLMDEYSVSVLPTVVFIASNGDRCVTTGYSGEENLAWGLKNIVPRKLAHK